MDTVTTTKTKHPGRVAQGHKLVALNRERKTALKEQPEQQPEQQNNSLHNSRRRQQSSMVVELSQYSFLWAGRYICTHSTRNACNAFNASQSFSTR